MNTSRQGPTSGSTRETSAASLERVLTPAEGENPWAWDGQSALLLTGRGAFVVRRESYYTYAYPAAPQDFRSAFGDTGREFVRASRGWESWGAVELRTKIPQEILLMAWNFLRAAWERYRTEDILLLYYWGAEKRYSLEHPELTAADQSGVQYVIPPTPVGAVLFGTFHSHPWMEAFHSATDDADVAGIPGLHFVLGNLDRPLPDLACFFSTGAVCRRFHPSDALLASCALVDVPAAWLVRAEDLPWVPLPRGGKKKEVPHGTQ